MEHVLQHEYEGLSEQSTIGPCKAGMRTMADHRMKNYLGQHSMRLLNLRRLPQGLHNVVIQ